MPVEDSKVFISYSRADVDFALKLGKDLKAKGINVWVDKLDIKPGEIWDNAVEEAMKTSRKVVIILSPTSVSSLNVMDELSYAFDEGKTIIPVMHIECVRPFRLRRRQFCDFTVNYEHGFIDLLRAFDVSENIIKAKSLGNTTSESAEAAFNAEEEKSKKAESHIKKKAEEEKRLKQEKELKRKTEEQERLKREQEKKEIAEVEKRQKEEIEAKRKLEEQEQLKKEAEAEKKAEEENRLEEEARLKQQREPVHLEETGLAKSEEEGEKDGNVNLKEKSNVLTNFKASTFLKNPKFRIPLFITSSLLVFVIVIWAVISSGKKDDNFLRTEQTSQNPTDNTETQAWISEANKKISDLNNLASKEQNSNSRPSVTSAAKEKPSSSPIYNFALLREFKAHTGGVTSVAFSPDGRHFLTGDDNSVIFWDFQGNPIHTLKLSNTVYSVNFSRDGKTILIGANGGVLLWDMKAKPIRIIDFTGYKVFDAVFAPDGNAIFTSSRYFQLWDLEGNIIKQNLAKVDLSRGSINVSPDGRFFVKIAAGASAILTDLSGSQINRFKLSNEGVVMSVAFSPDSQTIFLGGSRGTATIWDLKGNLIQTFQGPVEVGFEKSQIWSAAYSPDGKTILTGNGNGTATLWDLKGNKIRTFEGNTGFVFSVAFSPDGKFILTGSQDNTARLWQIKK